MTAPIELFTLRETASALRMNERTVREHLKRHRFPKAGGRWLFTRAEINALYEAIKCPSNCRKGPAATSGTSWGPSLAKTSARVRELLTSPKQKSSSPPSAKKSSNVTPLVRKPPVRS